MLCPSMPVVATGLHHDVKHAGPKKGPRTKPCVAFRRGGFLGQKTAPKMGPRILKIFRQGINLKHAAGCGTTASWLRLDLAGSGALRAPFPSREKPRQFVRGGENCCHGACLGTQGVASMSEHNNNNKHHSMDLLWVGIPWHPHHNKIALRGRSARRRM